MEKERPRYEYDCIERIIGSYVLNEKTHQRLVRVYTLNVACNLMSVLSVYITNKYLGVGRVLVGLSIFLLFLFATIILFSAK
jgi:hypothetical protein